jgi:TPR repeat protein
MYLLGKGVPKDEKAGLDQLRTAQTTSTNWLQSSMALRARNNLGLILSGSKELAQQAEGVKILEQSPAKTQEILFALGRAYGFGQGVAIDNNKAISYFGQAWEQFHYEPAQGLMAHVLLQKGDPKDRPTVETYWLHALQANDIFAIRLAMVTYRYGTGGMPNDPQRAYAWALVARQHNPALTLDQLLPGWNNSKLSPEQIDAAQKMADQSTSLGVTTPLVSSLKADLQGGKLSSR